MNIGNTLFNPINMLKHRELIPPMKLWIHHRLSQKFSFIPSPKNPFEKLKRDNDKIDFIVYKMISNALECHTPLMMGRYGSTECQAMRSILLNKYGIQDYIHEAYNELCIYSGFFQKHITHPTKQDKKIFLEKFTEIMLDSTKNCDVFGVWNGTLAFEEYFLKKYAHKNIVLTNLLFFSPNIHKETPFTYAFKDRKILVIHPFSQTIQEQYRHFDKLFKNSKVLPKFDLQTFKAVQTLHQECDDRFSDWFEALDWMSEEISKFDFDIALLGCGAYGFPLASRIKKLGKIAIHFGGTLQLLFGIKGKRWETEQAQIGQELFNKYWVYPNQKEKIKNSSKIEESCYWD